MLTRAFTFGKSKVCNGKHSFETVSSEGKLNYLFTTESVSTDHDWMHCLLLNGLVSTLVCF